MDNLYLQSIYEYLLTKKEENKYNFNVLSSQEGKGVAKKLSTGDWSLLPLVVISGSYEYVTTDLQTSGLDFSKELPAILFPSITILADNVSDIVEIEKVITKLFYDSTQLKINHPYNNSESITFDIVIDKSKDVDRTSKELAYDDGNRTIYQIILHFQSTANIVFMRNFHPAEIEFDKYVQLQLAERGKALEELRKQTIAFTDEQVQQMCSGYDEIMSLLGISGFDGFGFSELFQIMSDNDCDFKTAMSECLKAVEEIAERKRKEEERIKRINETYSKINKRGDSVINRYTDAVIADIRNRMNFSHPVPIYGSSTFLEWQQRNEVNELEYPNILVTDSIEFSFAQKVYQTVDREGNIIVRPFSTEILPVNLQLKIKIHAKSHAQCEELTNHLLELYNNPKEVIVSLPVHEKESFHISIHYDEQSNEKMRKINERRNSRIGQDDAMQDDDSYINELWFYNIPCIYFEDEQNKIDISNNRRLQINLLEQAIFCCECAKKLNTIYTPLANYEFMTSGKSSMLGFLFSKDVRTLKNCYDNRFPIDRELFNRVFSEMINIYPYLYDKTIHGWSYEQVKADIKRYSELFNRKYIDTYTLLGVRFKKEFIDMLSYAPENLRKYVSMMKNNKNISLPKAIATVEKELRAERMNVEIDTSNSGGGILSGLAHQAIESHNIKNNADDRTRRDLIGHAGCAKTHGGNCSTCNLRFSCSRYF